MLPINVGNTLTSMDLCMYMYLLTMRKHKLELCLCKTNEYQRVIAPGIFTF